MVLLKDDKSKGKFTGSFNKPPRYPFIRFLRWFEPPKRGNKPIKWISLVSNAPISSLLDMTNPKIFAPMSMESIRFGIAPRKAHQKNNKKNIKGLIMHHWGIC